MGRVDWGLECREVELQFSETRFGLLSAIYGCLRLRLELSSGDPLVGELPVLTSVLTPCPELRKIFTFQGPRLFITRC